MVRPLSVIAAVGGVAVAGIAWGAVEAQAFTTRRVELPLLPRGAAPVRILHLSDLHLTPGQQAKARWVRSLADEGVDLVVNTGDNLAHHDAVPTVLYALDGLLDAPGVFVYGSNDYYGPHAKNPFGYFAGPSKPNRKLRKLPTSELTQAFEARGWLNLNNARGVLEVAGKTVSFVGLDDPHLNRDVLPSGEAASADLHLGVVHAPYARALGALRDDGAVLTLAGHTHGGQVCVPGFGALVTNCDLDRRKVKGLHGWPGEPPTGQQGDDSMWLHVSAGVGTSPFVPLRFACRPEATVINLVAVREGGAA